ncbi:fluoride efflux transporter CrcB [Geomesophilobacter sediminis]|uniref:Fluoride-specific ion channel FluC n=1 Tax=Geomesophilobacter sediminis TaxID=2798584 RepID=A0A8J7M0S6_9BACT|nr:fluoride efflux transporter CrcB [Geomesophilobacter sediminis]MBJ6726518.1 fluoride efflux transporter CrcB [Geomesophilobacter sediminis]
MEQIALIAVFGALGCLARYFVSGWVYDLLGRSFPYGTFAVNIIGAFLIGFIMEFSLRSALVSPSLRVALTIGFLGGLTTFSTFSFETFRLIEDGALLIAFGNIMASVLACLLCTWIGIMAARAL